MTHNTKLYLLLTILITICIILLLYSYHILSTIKLGLPNPIPPRNPIPPKKYNDRNMPLIFIGGVPRSGTTLMRALLDAHPDIRCGEETRIIPRLLFTRMDIETSKPEMRRLKNAGIPPNLLDDVFSNAVLEVITRHGSNASNLCNKDPLILQMTIYLSYLFPNSKFILMIRDGRAVIHSVISRTVTITGFNLKNKTQCLTQWDQRIAVMYSQCIQVGPTRCLPVYYEQLVLNKEKWLHRIFEFLDIPWHDDVLHHEDFIGKPDGISISSTEFSTSQIIKPINKGALTTWLGFYDSKTLANMAKIAPMLSVLGYNPNENPPDYLNPDDKIRDNILHLTTNKKYRLRYKNVFDKLPYNKSCLL